MSQYVEPKTPEEINSLPEAIERIVELENMLAKFASAGIAMSNARFNLAANGRTDEPGGGYWINGVAKAILKPNDILFFEAVATFGKARTESLFLAAMKEITRKHEELAKLNAATPASPVPS